MPYDKTNMPENVKKMPGELQNAWINAFNAAFTEYKDEGKAMATANSMINKMGYKKNEKGDYVKAEKAMEIFSTIEFAPGYAMSVSGGKMFIKELVHEGSYVHPQDSNIKINITVEKMMEWVNNFNKKLIDIPFVPLKHTDDPEKNTGDVVDLWIADSPTKPGRKSLFGKLLIKIDEIAEKIGKTIKGDSIGIVKVTSPETGEYLGEALEHVALTNRPYIQGLGDFQPVNMSKLNYVFERETGKDQIGGKDMTEEELNKKMAEFQRVQDEKLTALSKQLEVEKAGRTELEKKNIELEKAKHASEVEYSLEKLVLSGKITPAEKTEKMDFAKSLNSDQLTKYIADLEKMPVKIKTGTQMGKQSDEVPADAPKLAEIHELAKKALSFSMSQAQFTAELDSIAERAKASGYKMDKTGVAIFKL